MKYPVSASNYTFSASAKTITFSGTPPAAIGNILHVANITRGVIYFQPQAGLAFSGSYTSPVLTLSASTSGHSNSDNLLVIVDDAITGLTDAQLRATAVPVSVAALPLPTGGATAANQATTNTTLGNIDTDLGATADAAATTDTGTFSLIALVKRGLQNWTTLLGRVPSNLTVTSTRLLVDGSGVTQPVSGPLTDTQLRAAAVPVAPNITRGSGVIDSNTQRVTLASDGPGVTSLNSIDAKTPALVNARAGVEPLGQPGVARQLSVTSSSANTALTTTCRRISVFARGADIRFAIGSTSQTASSTSHYIANGERLDLVVPATPNIAVIRAGSIDGTLEVMELV